jgi:hypothetical protein
MILKRLKSNSAINLFFVPIVVIAFWFSNLMHPVIHNFYPGETDNVLFSPFFQLTQNNALAQVITSIILVLALSYGVQLINDKFLFIRIRSNLPAFIFALIISGLTSLHTLHPVYFGALFMLLSIYRLFSIFGEKKAYSAIFDVGFLWGIGSLFYFNLIFIFPALLGSIVILGRETRWREFIILLLGLATPFIFTFSYGFLTDKTLLILKTFESNIITPVEHIFSNTALIIYLSAIVFFVLIGTINIFHQFDTKKISSRKYFSVMFGLFILSVLVIIFVPATSHEMLVITAIPTTYLISNLFVFMKSRFWSELLFFLLLGFVIFMQFSQYFIHA